MSFLYGALLQGGSAHHNTSDRLVETTSQAKRLRKSKSHASYLGGLDPLVRLVRDPVTSIEGLLERVWVGEDVHEKDLETGNGDRKQILRVRMKDVSIALVTLDRNANGRQAAEYSAWRSAAMELDRLEANDEWKSDPESPFYDHIVLQARLHELNEARLSGDTSRMLFLLRTSLTRSLGNMGDINLYKHSHIGTKVLIEDYISAACATLEALTSSSESKLEPRFTLDQLLATRQAFGRSALLLSGGGTFGMNHSGVVKALWESHLLPRIVSGSSAGAIVSAVLCTKTDEEIPETLDDFCYGDLEVFEKTGEEESLLRKAARFAKFGSVFDIQHLVKVMRGLLGDLTFQEAYNRTRRILNISVSSASLHELPRLLNYVTAPNVIIWSAV
jgi:TAG lipase / steryl ester hydrolase / phospholipase A2 / LPA acyltransferase